MVARKKERRTLFSVSWNIVKNNKILFVPNIIIFLITVGLFLLLLHFTGLGSAILQNDFSQFKSIISSLKFLTLFLSYFLLSFLIDNYFLAMKYGLIKGLLLKGKTSFGSGIKFANTHYSTTLGIHVLSALIVFVPLLLLAVLLFFLLPITSLVATALFVPLLVTYLVYIGIRLIFVYPVMTFEKKGAYNSLKEDFHFVKTHLHHTFITWLIVIGIAIFMTIFRENLIKVGSMLHQQLIFLGFLLLGLIIAVEVAVSVWEHVFIFKSYLVGRKS